MLAAVLGLQVLSLARIAAVHRDGYTPAADALATVRGDPCGLQSALQVETDPAAGVLAVAPQPAPVPGVVPAPALPPAVPAEVDAGGTTLPGVAVAGTGATPWFTLDARQRAGTLPVVVTVTGTPRPGDVLNAEFARGAAGARDGPAGRRGRRRPHRPAAARPARGRHRPAGGHSADAGRRRRRRRSPARPCSRR